jgi:nitroreductase
MDPEQLSSLIQKRRAIYPATYTDEIIPDQVIKDILEAARWAPNHKKTEPWRFKVFKGEARQKLGEYLAGYYRDNTPMEKFTELKYRKTLQKPMEASHVIALCIKVSGKVPEWEEVAALACGVQNMWLTCTALRLGCYWSTPASAINGRDIFDLEEDEKCYGLFYIGKPKPIALTVPGKRESLKNKIKWYG